MKVEIAIAFCVGVLTGLLAGMLITRQKQPGQAGVQDAAGADVQPAKEAADGVQLVDRANADVAELMKIMDEKIEFRK